MGYILYNNYEDPFYRLTDVENYAINYANKVRIAYGQPIRVYENVWPWECGGFIWNIFHDWE